MNWKTFCFSAIVALFVSVFLGLLLKGNAAKADFKTAAGTKEDAKWRQFALKSRELNKKLQHEGKLRTEVRRAIIDLAREMGFEPSEIRSHLGN